MIAYTKSVLIITEMQNDMISGPLRNDKAIEVASKVAEFIKTQRFRGIIFTAKVGNSVIDYQNTQEVKVNSVPSCIAGTSGRHIYSELGDAVKECKKLYGDDFQYEVIDRYISFEDATLSMVDYIEDWLESERSKIPLKEKVQNIHFYIAGTRTDGAVLNTALALRHVPDFNKYNEITVLSDLCSADTEERHNAALTVLKNNSINIKTVKEALKRDR